MATATQQAAGTQPPESTAPIDSYRDQAEAVSRLCEGLIAIDYEPEAFISPDGEDDETSRGHTVGVSNSDPDPAAYINGDLVADLRGHNGSVAEAVVHHLQWVADEQQKLADQVRELLAATDLTPLVEQVRTERASRPPEEPKPPRQPEPEIEVLEVLPGDRAIISTDGFVRLRHGVNGSIDEMVPRSTAEDMVDFFADWRKESRPRVEEYPLAEAPS